MSDFLATQLPKYYRLDLSEKLATLIKQGRSVNIVGLAAVGKFTYINFFLHNKKHFIENEENYRFLVIDLREFSGKGFGKFKDFFIQKASKLDPEIQGKDLLEKISSQFEVFTIIRHIETLDRKLLKEIWKYFLLARQLPYKFRFIFLSNRPLSETTEDDAVISRLFGTEEYFKPTSQKDFALEIAEYEKFLGLSISLNAREKLYELTGGHGGYTKLVLGYQKEKLLKYLESDLYELVNEKKKLTPELENRSKEVLGVFTDEEIKILTQMAGGKDIAEVSPFIYNLGVIVRENGKRKIFSHILETFLQSQT